MVFTVTYDPLPNITLVKAVEKYPVLYNSVSNSRKTVDEAWEKVAEEVNDTNVCCKERWLNLRNSYKRYLRQKQSNAVKKPYYLADYMEFLEPFIVLGGSRSDKNKKDGENVSDTETSLPPQEEDALLPPLPPPDKEDDDVDEDDDDMSIDFLDHSSSGACDAMTNESNSKLPANMRNMTTQTLLPHGIRQVNLPEENFIKNPDLAFFISILPDIRTMTEEQNERFRKEVVDSLDNILYAEDLQSLIEFE